MKGRGITASSIRLYTPDEIEGIRESAQIVGRCLIALASEVRPGVTTLELDRMAEQFIRDAGGEPAFKGYRGYPASICASVNEEVVHGIPSAKRTLREGDILSLDIGVDDREQRRFIPADCDAPSQAVLKLLSDGLGLNGFRCLASHSIREIDFALV